MIRVLWASRSRVQRRSQLLRWRAWAEPLERRLLLAAIVTVGTAPGAGSASEQGPAPGIFELTRVGDIDQELTVAFSLGGTATRDADYQLLDTAAVFPAGSSKAHVAFLPKNDALNEVSETVRITLEGGEGYTLGTPSTATIQIENTYNPGTTGATAAGVWDVFDFVELPTDPFYDGLPADLRYLNAAMDQNLLAIALGYRIVGTPPSTEIFIDADRNPATGDVRAGRVHGADYRITFEQTGNQGFGASWKLFRLPSNPVFTPPLDPSADPLPDIPVAQGTPIYNEQNGLFFIVVNRAFFGTSPPTNVDLFAVSHINTLVQDHGNGDRIPNYGWFNTSSQQVVVRRAAPTRIAFVPDPLGDNQTPAGSSVDFTGVTYQVLADQFQVALHHAGPISATGPVFGAHLQGSIRLDTDQDLFTGDLFLGSEIPTWGGDFELIYNLNAQAQVVELDVNPSGASEPFGDAANDGRWIVRGNTLFFTTTLATLDPVVRGVVGEDAVLVRSPTDGAMHAAATAWVNAAVHGDASPGGLHVADTRTGAALPPLVWDPQSIVSMLDPADAFDLVDIRRLDAQVTGENLILRGVLPSLPQTDDGSFYDIYLDTDIDAGTGWTVVAPNSAAIGADLQVRVLAAEILAPYWSVNVLPFGGIVSEHGAMARVRANLALGIPGSFTVTIPFALLGAGGPPPARVRLLVTTSDAGGAGEQDVAPNEPFVISLLRTPPVVQTLTATPAPVPLGSRLTLSAQVADAEDDLWFVSFYRESNGVPGLQIDADQPLGTDTSAAAGWSVTVHTHDFGVGGQTYYAVAADIAGLISNVSSLGGAVAPPRTGYQGTTGNDAYRVALDAGLVQIYQNAAGGDPPVAQVPVAALSGLTFDTLGGDDTLIIDGALAFVPVFNADDGNDRLIVNAGTYALNAASGVERLAAGGSALIHAAAGRSFQELTVTGSARLALAAGADKFLRTFTLNVSGGATLDLADNALIIDADAASRDAVLAAASAAVRSARNSPAGRWTGPGITTSDAGAQSVFGLAVVANPGLAAWMGQDIAPNSVLVVYTLDGDRDLNQRIDIGDYFAMDAGRAQRRIGYAHGDFDHSGGAPTADDAMLIDRAFLAQGTFAAQGLVPMWPFSPSAVPAFEPSDPLVPPWQVPGELLA